MSTDKPKPGPLEFADILDDVMPDQVVRSGPVCGTCEICHNLEEFGLRAPIGHLAKDCPVVTGLPRPAPLPEPTE
jgi:hypothetical protein